MWTIISENRRTRSVFVFIQNRYYVYLYIIYYICTAERAIDLILIHTHTYNIVSIQIERDRKNEMEREKYAHIPNIYGLGRRAVDMTADDRVFGIVVGGEGRERLVYTGV